MGNSTFHNNLTRYVKSKDAANANRLLMYELGNILVRHKADFVELLVQSDVYADSNMSDIELIDAFVDNVDKNKKLMLGASLLVNVHNKSMGFDGEDELSDEGVKMSYAAMKKHFDDGYSNLGGAIAGAVSESAKLGQKISEGQQKKKYGALDLLTKKQDAKSQLMQSIIAQKQAEALAKQKKQEQRQKTMKIVIISTVVVVGIIGIIYAYKKFKP